MQIYRLFTVEEAERIEQTLKEKEWGQGKAGNEYATGVVKQNKEIEARDADEETVDIMREIHSRIVHHEDLMNSTWASQVTVPKFNRYDVGDAYHTHADAALMGGAIRTDLSYTLFLSKDFKGGELCANGMSVVCDPGQIVVYECGYPHYVSQVLDGSRICAIGWIQSLVRDQEHRTLMNLSHSVLKDIDRNEPEGRLYARLSCLHGKLIRKWIE